MNLVAVVAIVGAALICPPAGIALGAAYGTAELTSAISGKDWVSGRELDTGERVFRGVLAPIDILPAASAFRSFSGVARTSRLGNGVKDLGINIKTGMKNVETKVVQINDAVVTATQQGSMRIKNANAVVKERVKEIPNKLANKAVDAAKVVDETYTNVKTFAGNIKLKEEFAFNGGVARQTAENTHTVENSVRNIVGRVQGVNIGRSGASGTGKSLNNTIKLEEIEVKFTRNPKHDSEEFARQLKDQEEGMNKLTVEEYLKNRDRYIAEGRAIEGNVAQKMARQEALKDKITELRRQGLSRADATKQASAWMETRAALHNPDQIAGGRADVIGGMGDKKVNSSLGSQWKYRINIVDEQIRKAAENMSPERQRNTYLNVKLTQ